MKINNILFPTDFSEQNTHALQIASTLASETGATLHILFVHDVRELTGEPSLLMTETWEAVQQQLEERLKKIVPNPSGAAFEHHTRHGLPIAEIVGFATDKNVDLIVMASHGRTGLSRILMGSIAEGVMRKAPCPVLIVKQPAEDACTVSAE